MDPDEVASNDDDSEYVHGHFNPLDLLAETIDLIQTRQRGKHFFLPSQKLQRLRQKRWRETKVSPKRNKMSRRRRSRLYREGSQQDNKKESKEHKNSHQQSVCVVDDLE